MPPTKINSDNINFGNVRCQNNPMKFYLQVSQKWFGYKVFAIRKQILSMLNICTVTHF